MSTNMRRRGGWLALALAPLVLTLLAGSVRADDDRGRWDDRGRGYEHQRWEHREHWRRDRYDGRGYYVSPPPPPVYYAPPSPPPGITLVFPIR